MSSNIYDNEDGTIVTLFCGGLASQVKPGTICYQINQSRGGGDYAVLAGPEAVEVAIAILKDALQRPGLVKDVQVESTKLPILECLKTLTSHTTGKHFAP